MAITLKCDKGNEFCFGWSEECQIFAWINIHEYINNLDMYIYICLTWICCVTLRVPDLEAAALAPVQADHALGEGHQAAGPQLFIILKAETQNRTQIDNGQ